MIRSHGGGKGCAREVNTAVAIFNKNLEDLVKDFNKNFHGAKFTYVDIFSGGDPLAFKVLGKLYWTPALLHFLSDIYIYE